MCNITIQSEGRRHYLVGNTYPIKSQLREAGCKWDGDRKAWWTGKREVAEQLASSSSSTPPASTGEREAPGEDATVAGRATYKGRTYYVAGREERGRTRYDDRVEPVTTRDGAKYLLLFRDGSKSFWAARAEVQVIKTYDRPKTIRSLQKYAEEARQARATGECACFCHREANAGAPGSILYDGCDRCGCEAC